MTLIVEHPSPWMRPDHCSAEAPGPRCLSAGSGRLSRRPAVWNQSVRHSPAARRLPSPEGSARSPQHTWSRTFPATPSTSARSASRLTCSATPGSRGSAGVPVRGCDQCGPPQSVRPAGRSVHRRRRLRQWRRVVRVRPALTGVALRALGASAGPLLRDVDDLLRDYPLLRLSAPPGSPLKGFPGGTLKRGRQTLTQTPKFWPPFQRTGELTNTLGDDEPKISCW
jgi:hypothetical protein